MSMFEPFVLDALGGTTYETPGDPGKHTFVFLRKPTVSTPV